MKNLLTAFFFLGAMCPAFAHVNSNLNWGNSQNENLVEFDLDDTSDCFSSNYSVYAQGVLFWRAAWFNYYSRSLDTSATQLTKAQLPVQMNQREFSYSNLMTVIGTPGYAGIRVYYGMTSLTDTIPVLIIVPVNADCEDLFISGDQCLVSNGYSQYFCSKNQAAALTKNWRDYASANPGFIKSTIYAYNYEAATLTHLMNNGSSTGGLMFELGLRTLSPQETDFMILDQNIYGSIVYCNLVYGTAYDPSNGAGRYDFARPCPHICDPSSILVTG